MTKFKDFLKEQPQDENLKKEYDALEPELCREILEFHHDKHYKTYVDNLNGIMKKVVAECGA